MPTASGRLPGGPGRGCGHTEETRPLELRGPHGRTPRPTIDMVSLTVGEKSQPGDGRGQAGCPSLQWPETLSSPFRQGLPKQVRQLWWVGWGVSGPGRGCPAALQPSAGRPHRHGARGSPHPLFCRALEPLPGDAGPETLLTSVFPGRGSGSCSKPGLSDHLPETAQPTP